MKKGRTREIEKSSERSVAIIGGAVEREHFDPKFYTEVWGLNAIRPYWIEKWDRMFNLHRFALLCKYHWPVEIDRAWARDNPEVPFYTTDKWPKTWLPNWEQLPRDAMARDMPRGDYHVSSIDWMVALAIWIGFNRITLHGIKFNGEEPISARACLEYWCGYAEGRGVKIVRAEDCRELFHFYHLVRSNLVYGYDDTPTFEDRTGRTKSGDPPYRYGGKGK